MPKRASTWAGLILTAILVSSGPAKAASVDPALAGKWYTRAQDSSGRAGRYRILHWNIGRSGSSTMSVILSESGLLSSNPERWGVARPDSSGEIAHGTYSLKGATSLSTLDAGMPYGSVAWSKVSFGGNAQGVDSCAVQVAKSLDARIAAPQSSFNPALVGLWQGTATKPRGERVSLLWNISATGHSLRLTVLDNFSVPVEASRGQITVALPNEPISRETYRVTGANSFETSDGGVPVAWRRCGS